MSAIWGMVDLKKKLGNEEIAIRMEEPYHKYNIDIYDKHVEEDVVLGYGGQYFTSEAKKEKQPIVNAMEGLFFVADVVLDNREELFDILDIKTEQRCNIPDGTLMFQILKKFGKKSYNMFLGTYAFVYYDKYHKEVILVADAVGSRSLYYNYDQGILYFSTLMKPILEVNKEENKWNYRFLSDYLALNNLSMYTEMEETPYQNIFKVAPGQTVVINERGLYKEEYWKLPIKGRVLRKSDEDFKKEFINLFDKCVSCVMRSSEKTGILLSGGLDSTSVACFAAPKLKEKGELLYSYTSIPETEYVSKEIPYYNTNEQKMVEITKDYLGNITSTFLELAGENGFDGAAEYMAAYELPYKSLQNIRWLHKSAVKAAEDGCRIMLTGQFGNSTISFGAFYTHFYSLLMAGHLIELSKEVNIYHRKYNLGRKKIYKYLIKNFSTNHLKKNIKVEDLFTDVYINPELINRYNIKKRFIKSGYAENVQLYTSRAIKPYMFNKIALIQIGELETHLSLSTGVLFRDPTRDKRMIEYCLKLPEDQFVHNGIERRLVREYLHDYLPKEIILDRHVGLQSADMANRLLKNWDHIHHECCALLEEDIASKLLDLPKIRDKMQLYKEKLPTDNFELMKILYSILLVKFANM